MAEKQYVVFKLDKEEYGIDIMNVREIIQYQESIKVLETKCLQNILTCPKEVYRGR